jgi:Ca2+/Na+ antiporter
MAFGGSSPEFATSMIGVFVAKSDIGVGTAVGSATCVYLVAGICSFFAPNCPLTPWPLCRDSAYYCCVISAMLATIADQKVE